MIEPASQNLVRTLLDLNLCSPHDLRRCRARVKRLAGDMPAFDSIWIDALLQARKLTPFQAGVLESGRRDRLRVGPCVLLDELGRSTFLARRREGRELCVIKLAEPSPEHMDSLLERLQRSASILQKLPHPNLVGPHAVLRDREHIVAVSRYVPGRHLGELLVRRGRFPPAIATEIGRQLIEGLAALERTGLTHGDIRLPNVRLMSNGIAVLVDAGLGPAISPALTFHSNLSPDRCDGIAPERIGTGNSATATSDLYALGCTIWHLLAGRPVFISGDPLAKLASHQTRPIPDIRNLAPDTPDAIAAAISRFTAMRAADRPQSFQQALEIWKGTRRVGRRRLATFYATFDSSVRPSKTAAASPGAGRWTWMLVLLFVLSGAFLTLVDSGARSLLLRWSGRGTQSIAVSQPAVAELKTAERPAEGPLLFTSPTVTAPSGPISIPGPNAENVIELESGQEYEAAEIATVGGLTIRSNSTEPAFIIVDRAPLRVVSEELTLENVTIRVTNASEGATRRPPAAALLADGQKLLLTNCRFEASGDSASLGNNSIAAAVGWRMIGNHDGAGGMIRAENCVFAVGDVAFFMSSRPRDVRFHNCLKTGGGTWLSLAASAATSQGMTAQLANCTQRQSESLIRVAVPEKRGKTGRVQVQTESCALELGGPQAALFQFVADSRPDEFIALFELVGNGSLVSEDVAAANWISPRTGAVESLDSAALVVEGIASSRLDFRGSDLAVPADSELMNYSGPRRGDLTPGIVAETLR